MWISGVFITCAPALCIRFVHLLYYSLCYSLYVFAVCIRCVIAMARGGRLSVLLEKLNVMETCSKSLLTEVIFVRKELCKMVEMDDDGKIKKKAGDQESRGQANAEQSKKPGQQSTRVKGQANAEHREEQIESKSKEPEQRSACGKALDNDDDYSLDRFSKIMVLAEQVGTKNLMTSCWKQTSKERYLYDRFGSNSPITDVNSSSASPSSSSSTE